ncbi:MAG: hypothetical protein M3450_01125 [Actinomycetota bacterium]|nr:hypothetical protein [Actinomycetota bacterium]MDQ3640084.1 hypothetical protein [Actinomycetota bacterium]MDQ3680223.1 hypothetical protein [Actinomycetota bacterium]
MGFDAAGLLSAYDSSITLTGKKGDAFYVDVPEGEVQAAWAIDAEKAYNKFAGQFVTYAQSVEYELDPVWRFVTGYYAALFSALSLLAITGTLRRRFGPSSPIPEGLWSVVAQPSVAGSQVLRVRGRRGGAAGSHHGTWTALADLFTDLSAVPGNDAHTQAVLHALADIVVTPLHLSNFRNALNYGLDEGPWSRRAWPCLLRDLRTPEAVEDAAVGGTRREEQRAEILMLACGSLVRSLFEDYRQRVRSDPRLRRWRKEHLELIAGTGFAGCTAVVHS